MNGTLPPVALFVSALAVSNLSCPAASLDTTYTHTASITLTEYSAFSSADDLTAEVDEIFSWIDTSNSVLAQSRPMTRWEQEVTEDFFWSQFD